MAHFYQRIKDCLLPLSFSTLQILQSFIGSGRCVFCQTDIGIIRTGRLCFMPHRLCQLCLERAASPLSGFIHDEREDALVIPYFSAGPYRDNLREAIHLVKYHGDRLVAMDLPVLLLPLLLHLAVAERDRVDRGDSSKRGDDCDSRVDSDSRVGCHSRVGFHSEDGQTQRHKLILIPVPLHPDKLMERGFNQVSCVARGLIALSRASGVDIKRREDVLVRTIYTQPQKGLKAHQRRDNVLGAFDCLKRLQGEHVILLDDVLTSGATISECARMLLQSGASKVTALTLGRATWRGASSAQPVETWEQPDTVLSRS